MLDAGGGLDRHRSYLSSGIGFYVATPVGDQQCAAVVVDLDEARLVALGRAVEPLACAALFEELADIVFGHPIDACVDDFLHRLAVVKRKQCVYRRSGGDLL